MSGRVMSLPYPFQLQMAKVEPREIVWKIAEAVLDLVCQVGATGEIGLLHALCP
jgi:hypothetical protein